ncbi:MAG: metallophosphoesterase family protein [Polyangiales bacterium]
MSTLRVRRAMVVLASVTSTASGCDRRSTRVAQRGAEAPLSLALALTLPHRPERCSYDVRAVMPSRVVLQGHAERLGGAPTPRSLHLSVVGSPSESMVVQWSTDARTMASEVRYGSSPTRLDHRAIGYSFEYVGAPGRRQHEVHLCGLQPSSTVYYDAGGEGARSAVYSFVTAPSDTRSVRVMVAGDSRTHPEIWGQIARRAAAMAPDAIFFSGDVTAAGEAQSQWDRFFEEGAALLARAPMFIADGNHDNPSQTYHAQFALPSNGDGTHHERWYRVDYGPIALMVLNDSTVAPSIVREVETPWLARELSAVDRARTPWLITMHHQPMYSTAVGHLPDELTRSLWEPLMDRAHVDVDLAGHVHNYESLFALRAGQIVDETRGTVRLHFGGAGAPLYPFRERQAFSRTRESVHGWAMLEVSGRELRWTAYRLDGTEIEQLRWAH